MEQDARRRSARCARSPARPSSTSCSSRRRGSRTRTSSAARATAGRWRSRRSCTSAPTLAFGAPGRRSRSRCGELIERAREAGGSTSDPSIRQRFAQLYIEAEVLRLNAYRGLTAIDEARRARARGLAGQVAVGRGQPGADRAGDGLARPARRSSSTTPWTYRFLRARANSIEGGTTEILKNIVAERVLGLPRRDELRPHRRPAGRSSAPRASSSPRATRRRRSGGSRSRTSAASPTRSGTRSPSSAGRSCRRRGARRARASASSSWPSSPRSSATRSRRRRCCSTWAAALLLGRRRRARAAGAMAARDGRAWDERRAARVDRSLRRRPLHGVKIAVPDADGADVLVVAATAAATSLVDARRRRRSSRRRRSTRRAGCSTVRARRRAGRGARRRRLRAAPGDAIAVMRRGRVGRRRPARDGDGGRLRQGAQAVRPPDRLLPGRLARLRADAARDRGRALGRPTGRRGRSTTSPRPAPLAASMAKAYASDAGWRVPAVRAAGPRRHRLHLGARPALLPQARPSANAYLSATRASTGRASGGPHRALDPCRLP